MFARLVLVLPISIAVVGQQYDCTEDAHSCSAVPLSLLQTGQRMTTFASVSPLQTKQHTAAKRPLSSPSLMMTQPQQDAFTVMENNSTRIQSQMVSGLGHLVSEVEAGCAVKGDSYKLRAALTQDRNDANDGDNTSRVAPGGDAQRKPVLWIHLHNFAGTYICKEALQQGEFTPPNGAWPGCLMPYDDCSTRNRNARSLCSARATSGYSFTAIERDVEAADFCEGALIGSTLRDPISGLTSTLLANSYDKQAIMNILKTGQPTSAEHSACLPQWDTYQHFDNFATRSLGGAYMELPLKVTRQHLELAKERLRRLDVLLILEDLPIHVPQLEAFLKWDTAEINTQKKENGHDCTKKETAFTDGELDFLKEVNALDYELYAYGKELAANLTLQARAML